MISLVGKRPLARISSWARSVWRIEWIAGSDLVVLHVDKLIWWTSIRNRNNISLTAISSRELGLSALARVSVGASDEGSDGAGTRHLSVFLNVEFGLVGAEEAGRAAVSLEGSRNIGLTSITIGTLSTAAANGTTDRALRRRIAV